MFTASAPSSANEQSANMAAKSGSKRHQSVAISRESNRDEKIARFDVECAVEDAAFVTADSAGILQAAQPTFTPALSQQFRERIRPLLNSIDRLRSHGLQNELRLPTVAVVGDQSVGKSSVLEAISGVDLPRGSGIVTRCPLQLSMRSKPFGDWTGKITFQNSAGQRTEYTIADRSEVNKFVRQAQNEITGNSAGVSHQQIDLTIEGPDVSDLTLVDLPGIARYSEKDPRISEVTKSLIRSYIIQEQVIILVVVPCSVDIETVEAIALAKEVDKKGTRTIGVLTCPDLTNPGSEDGIRDIVSNNGSVRLSKGFVMVKCRTQKELMNNVSLSKVAQLEAEYFASHSHYSKLPKDLVGTKTLAEKLTDELFRAVASGIETLEVSLKAKLKEYEEELKELGDSLCDTDSDRRCYLMRKLPQFLAKLHSATATPEDQREAFATGSSSQLYSQCLHACTTFGGSAITSIPDWLTDYSEPVPCTVHSEVLNRRGRELQTFTFVFPVVQKIVCDDYLPRIEELSHTLLSSVESAVSKTLTDISTDCFKAFPKLLQIVKDAVTKTIEAQEAKCRADLQKLLSHERRVYTQDSQFSARLKVVTKQKQKYMDEHPPSQGLQRYLFSQSNASHDRTRRAPTSTVTQQSSTVEPSSVDRIRMGAAAYLDLASSRIADTVPLSVLSHMLDGVDKQLTDELTKLFAGGTDQELAELLSLLQEKHGRQRRRWHLEHAIKQMHESQLDLQKAKQSQMLLDD